MGVHGDFISSLWFMSCGGFCKTPFSAVVIHKTNFGRGFYENPTVQITNGCTFADSFYICMSRYVLNLFFCHFLKSSVAVTTDLTESVHFIVGIYGHYYGKQRGK